MYKNLNTDLLMITGRQSEIIELALTYGFRSITIDMDDLVKRCQRTSFESATKFLVSSKLKIGGFDLPIDLDADDETFSKSLAALNGVAEIAARTDATTAVANIPNGTDRLPYPEYFDVIRRRVDEVASVLEKEGVKLAIAFSAIPAPDEEKQFKFVRDVEGFLALFRACTSKNVYFVFDAWNWFVGGGTEEQLDAVGLARVAIVRLADCSEGVDAAAATMDDCLLPTSTGVIDCISYLRKFATAGLSLPVSAAGRTQESATRDALIGQAQDALDKCFSEAGLPSQTRKPEMFMETSYSRE